MSRKIDSEKLAQDMMTAIEFINNTYTVVTNLWLNKYIDSESENKIHEDLLIRREEIQEKYEVVMNYVNDKTKYNMKNELKGMPFFTVEENDLNESREKAQECLDWWTRYDKSFFLKCDFEIEF